MAGENPTTTAAPAAPAMTTAGVPGSGPVTTPAVPGGAPSAPSAPAADGWMGGLSSEHRGWLQAKGVSDPGQLVTMWKGMESVMGLPKERIAALPQEIKSLDDAKPVLSRLGVPNAPHEYGLAGNDGAFTKEISQIFHNASLTKHQAERVSAEFNAYQTRVAGEKQAAYEAAVNNAKQALVREWGAAHDSNLAVAKQAARKFGATEAVIAAMEKSSDYASVMKFFHQLGLATGEAKFVTGAPGTGLMTPEQATSEIERLKNDKEWVARYTKGGAAEIKKMSDLIAAANGLTL